MPVPATKANELLKEVAAISTNVVIDEVRLQGILRDARGLMRADPAGAHAVQGIVAGVRGDAAGVKRHCEQALALDPRAEAWANYSTALAFVDENEAALVVAKKGMDAYPGDVRLVERAIEAALESGSFREGWRLCARGEGLASGPEFHLRDRLRDLAAAVEAGRMSEDGARGVIGVLTEVQRSAKAVTVGLEVRSDGEGSFLYDRYVRCSPVEASALNWRVAEELVDRDDLQEDPGRVLLVGLVGVVGGGSA